MDTKKLLWQAGLTLILIVAGFAVGQWLSSGLVVPLPDLVALVLGGIAVVTFALTYVVRKPMEKKDENDVKPQPSQKNGILSPDEAREWLDDFLKQQQDAV